MRRSVDGWPAPFAVGLRGGTRRVACARALAMLASLCAASPALAQTSVGGGPLSLVWPSNCATTVPFVNDTNLPLAGFWIGIGLDGVTNPPEIGTISVHDTGGGKTWDVDDNEDQDDDDAGENDEIDSSPTIGVPGGWHRVQARANADTISPGQGFTIRLCDQSGGSLAGRTIFLVPLARNPGEIAGDRSKRAEAPFGVSEAAPSGSVTMDGFNAPPGSSSFSVATTNADGAKRLKKLRIDPTAPVDVQSASASGGGVYDVPSRTIIWPTPVPVGDSTQVDVTLTGFPRLLVTTIGFEATEFVTFVAPVPALPAWSLALLVAAALALLLLLARRH